MIGLKNSYELAYNGTENECRFDLYADTAADLQGLTHIDGIKIQMGSECTEIATGDKYLLNGYGAWILQPSQNAFSNVYTKTEIDAMIANYYTKTESDAQFEWITVTITTDTLPLSFISDGTPLTSVVIKGNGVQNGTPSPDNIIMPTFCGKLVGTDWTIPLTCAGQTTPLYLGEVSTTRRVRKLVLTGKEAWSSYSGVVYLPNIVDYLKTDAAIAYCSHYQQQASVDGVSETVNGHIAFSKGSNYRLCIRDSNYTSGASFATYLAAEYAAGHPVTVWYVLASPETGIVNEPLMKIGDYADELTTTTPIPTAKGSNTLSVDTTVQPSEVSITGGIRNE